MNDPILLTSSDAEKIADIEKACFSVPWSENSVTEMLKDSLSHFYGIEEDGKLAAYLGFNSVLDEVNIYDIAVLPDYRRKGFAKRLLEKAEEFCKENKISKLMLEVRESNTGARKLYSGFGCIEEGKRKNYYNNPKEDAILMTKYY